MSCRNDNCNNCDGNYPEIASAFIRVPNNFDSVNNSIDKFTLYKTLAVVEKAVEHVQCGSRKCAETGKRDVFDFNSAHVDIWDLGFLQFPLRIRTDFVQVCGEGKCADVGHGRANGGCECCTPDDIDCGDAVLGYIQWPKHQVAQDVRACNAIKDNIACRRGNRGPEGSRPCRVVADCDESSSSSSSVDEPAAAVAAAAAEVVATKKVHSHKKRGGCGCH